MLASKSSGDVCLANVLYFAQVFCKVADGKVAEWVAAVKWYETHQCRVWFGYPIEVWGPMQEPGYSLIPLTAIKSRVIHKKMLVNFGRIIDVHSVVVAVPLENNSLF